MAVFNMQRPSVQPSRTDAKTKPGYGSYTKPQTTRPPQSSAIPFLSQQNYAGNKKPPAQSTQPIRPPQPAPTMMAAPPPTPHSTPMPGGFSGPPQFTQPTGPRLGGGAMPFMPQPTQTAGPSQAYREQQFSNMMNQLGPSQSTQPIGQRLGGSMQQSGALADALARRQGMNPAGQGPPALNQDSRRSILLNMLG